MPTQNEKSKDDLPSHTQLFEAAIRLKAACRHDVISSTPDNQSCIKDALELWFDCDRALAELRKERAFREAELKELSAKIRRPAEFPTDLHGFLQSVLPENSVEERLNLYRRYVKETQRPPIKGTWQLRNLRAVLNQPDPATGSEEWIDQTIDRDKEPTAFTEQRFLSEAAEFLQWLIENKAENLSSRGKKGSNRRWAIKVEAERTLKEPSNYPVDRPTLLKHAIPEVTDEKERVGIFEAWLATRSKAKRNRIENLTKGGFTEDDFKGTAVAFRAWFLAREGRKPKRPGQH